MYNESNFHYVHVSVHKNYVKSEAAREIEKLPFFKLHIARKLII